MKLKDEIVVKDEEIGKTRDEKARENFGPYTLP